jgi:hypothetical protein
MKTPLILLAAVLVILIAGGAWYFYGTPKVTEPDPRTILSFEACVAAGYPVMESHPRQCRTPDGRTYAEEPTPAQIAQQITYTNATADNIVVTNPTPGAVTGKSFKVTGKARGPWYFEASFPVRVLDKTGKVIATGIAQAQGDWMTTEFVPFAVDITVPESYIGPATLVFQKDNPSGLPEHEASISFPFTIEY